MISLLWVCSEAVSHTFQILGGDSAVNGLVWIRGAQAEYDAYEQLGNPGWNWDNMYAAMKKVRLPAPLDVNKD